MNSESTDHAPKARTVYSDEQREKIVNNWRQSGLSKVEFCRRIELRPDLLYKWTRPTGSSQSSSPRLMPAVVNSTHGPNHIEIQLPNGVVIKIPPSSSPKILVEMLGSLMCN